MVGMKCGKCCECGKDAHVDILGKHYCYKHGREHTSKAVDIGLANAIRRHGLQEAPKRV